MAVKIITLLAVIALCNYAYGRYLGGTGGYGYPVSTIYSRTFPRVPYGTGYGSVFGAWANPVGGVGSYGGFLEGYGGYGSASLSHTNQGPPYGGYGGVYLGY